MKALKKYHVLILIVIFWMDFSAGFAQKKSASNQSYQEWNRFSIEFGGYLTNISSNFRLGADNLGIGLDINFEQALGLETTSLTYYGQFLYRFSKNRRHALKARYFQIVRKSSKVIEADIEVNDRIFEAGTELGSSFKLGVGNFDYSYSFLMDDRININASFGFFVMPIKLAVGKDDNIDEQTEFVAPLPVLGIESYFKLSKKFALRQEMHLFYLKLNYLEGRMSELSIMLEYNPIPSLGIGFGYNAFNLDVSQEKNARPILGDLVGKVGYKHSGLLFYGNYNF